MGSTSRIVAIEIVYPEGPAVPDHGLADLDAMVLYGGRDRTPREWAELLGAAGLRLSRIVPADGAYSFVEAVPR